MSRGPIPSKAAIPAGILAAFVTFSLVSAISAKAEELQALVFMHPQDSAVATGVVSRVQGNGFLENVIGNPLETTIFLSHLIFEGTLDKFPNLKLCAAHAGGCSAPLFACWLASQLRQLSLLLG